MNAALPSPILPSLPQAEGRFRPAFRPIFSVLLAAALLASHVMAQQMPCAEAAALQREHRFDEALAALDRGDAADGTSVASLRLRATIHLVRGEYAMARRSAAAMAFSGDQFGALVIGGVAAAETGGASRADEMFAAAVSRADRATSEEMAWCLTAMAEHAARAHREDEARILFGQALEQWPDAAYSVCAFADFLIARGDPAAARALVANKPPSAGFLLRRVLAEKALDMPDFAANRDRLESMLLSSEAGGAHLREHARFELEVAGRPARALELARRNWAVQREPADTLLLVRAAVTQGDDGTLAEVAAWARESGFRDEACDAVAGAKR